MDELNQGQILHLIGERLEQMGSLKQGGDLAINIAVEHDGCFGWYFILASGEAARFHEILEDLDAVCVLEADSSHFVEGDYVP